jgi:hypothetical protein
MADRWWTCEYGTTMKEGVTERTGDSSGEDVALRVTYDATQNSKQATLMAIDAIRQRIVEETWPPV